MAIVRIFLDPLSAIPYPVVANAARHKIVDGSSYSGAVLVMDPATDQGVFWQFITENYGSGNLSLDIWWYADTASSGDVEFGAQLAAITANTDTQDFETDGLAGAQTVVDSHLGTTGQRLHKVTLTISNLDSLANGDYATILLYRNADGVNDTLTGDVFVTMCELTYSDT